MLRRIKSKTITPIAIRIHHRKTRYIILEYSTLKCAWDERNGRLKKSNSLNQFKDCEAIEEEINEKLYLEKKKTAIYLKSFENQVLDEANERIVVRPNQFK